MASQRPSPRLMALLGAIMVFPPIVFVVSLPWLKQQPQSVAFLVAGVTATVVIAASLALSVLHDRKLDEWHRTGARLSGQWGGAIGVCLTGALLAIPPIRDAIVAIVSGVADTFDTGRDYKMVTLAFTIGFCTLALIQALCSTVVYYVWNYRMSRPAKDVS